MPLLAPVTRNVLDVTLRAPIGEKGGARRIAIPHLPVAALAAFRMSRHLLVQVEQQSDSYRSATAIDGKHDALDETGLVGCQVDDSVGNLFRRGRTACGRQRRKLIERVPH